MNRKFSTSASASDQCFGSTDAAYAMVLLESLHWLNPREWARHFAQKCINSQDGVSI